MMQSIDVQHTSRRGPSMCPGTDDETMDLVLPTLRKVAAKDADGAPCVARIGTGGAGHYCKMIHNGIEHGVMSAIAEAYGIMRDGLSMNLDEIGDEFERWNSSGELKNTFLIKISIDICRAVDQQTKVRVLDTVEDKVVQDFTGEEGTGIWSNTEAVEQHVPAPTLSTAHFFRIASGDRHQRSTIQKAFSSTPLPPQAMEVSDRAKFLEDLRLAVFTASLAAFAQGMNIIDKADRRKHFNIDYTALLHIWRAGCIIQADYIVTELLAPIYARKHAASSNSSLDETSETNPLYEPAIAQDFKRGLPSLKRVVARGVESDAVIPALSASLEYLKIQTSTALPTSFYEAQLDYFGAHMYDKKGEDKEGKPTEGKYHYEWKPA
nr:6-phosphogluconate dehydrogenase, decarboxylating [Quercus suber]